jgi:hypothetical protein
MLGRAWVSVVLTVARTGCVSRSRPEPSLPKMNIPLECATSICPVDCDRAFSPPRCRTAAITYHKWCEQMLVVR